MPLSLVGNRFSAMLVTSGNILSMATCKDTPNAVWMSLVINSAKRQQRVSDSSSGIPKDYMWKVPISLST